MNPTPHDTWSALRTVFDSAGVGSPAFRDRATTLFDAAWPRLLVEQRRAALFAHDARAVAAVVAEPGLPLRATLAAWRLVDAPTAALALEFGVTRRGVLAALLPRARVATLVTRAWPELRAPFERPLADGASWVVFVTAVGTELVDLALGDAGAWTPRAFVDGEAELVADPEGGAPW